MTLTLAVNAKESMKKEKCLKSEQKNEEEGEYRKGLKETEKNVATNELETSNKFDKVSHKSLRSSENINLRFSEIFLEINSSYTRGYLCALLNA